MSELNPNHPVVRTLHDQWHGIAAVMVRKFGVEGNEVIITQADLARLQSGNCLVVQELEDGLHLKLVDEETAVRIARKEGGLPT